MRKFTVDFREYEGVMHDTPPLFQAADDLKRMREKVEQLTAGGRLKVIAYSRDDLDQEHEASRVMLNLARLSPEKRQEVVEFITKIDTVDSQEIQLNGSPEER